MKREEEDPPLYEDFARDVDAWAARRDALLGAGVPSRNEEAERAMRAEWEAEPCEELKALSLFEYPQYNKWMCPVFCDPFRVLGEEDEEKEEWMREGRRSCKVDIVVDERTALSFQRVFPKDIKELIVSKMDARSLFVVARVSREMHDLASKEIEVRKKRVERTPQEWEELRNSQMAERKWLQVVAKASALVKEWKNMYTEIGKALDAIEGDVQLLEQFLAHFRSIDADVAKSVYKQARELWVRPDEEPAWDRLAHAEKALQDPLQKMAELENVVSFAEVRAAFESATKEIHSIIAAFVKAGEMEKQRQRQAKVVEYRRRFTALIEQSRALDEDWTKIVGVISFVRDRLPSDARGRIPAPQDLPFGLNDDVPYWTWVFRSFFADPFGWNRRSALGDSLSATMNPLRARDLLLLPPSIRRQHSRPYRPKDVAIREERICV